MTWSSSKTQSLRTSFYKWLLTKKYNLAEHPAEFSFKQKVRKDLDFPARIRSELIIMDHLKRKKYPAAVMDVFPQIYAEYKKDVTKD